MADPLSTIASVIALCQATRGIFKGVQIIRSLPKAPAEFHELWNEVSFHNNASCVIFTNQQLMLSS